MPPVLSTLNHSFEYCSQCQRDIPATPRNWNTERKMCADCARQRPLTIRIPAATVRCTLCSGLYPPRVFSAGHGRPAHSRCSRCRLRERCYRCRKIKRRKHFKRPSIVDENAPNALFKSCDHCRAKEVQRGLRQRQRAADAGLKWCPICRMQISEDDCRDDSGTVRATCNHQWSGKCINGYYCIISPTHLLLPHEFRGDMLGFDHAEHSTIRELR